MNPGRILRHLLATDWHTRRLFPDAVLDSIETAVRAAERLHGGEIRFALETALGGTALLRGTSSRRRALEVFAQLGVWNTERNNGVLIYLLVADRSVEIVADRGFNGRIAAAEWRDICTAMEQEFRAERFESGAIAGIHAVGELIARHYPRMASDANELPDPPVIL